MLPRGRAPRGRRRCRAPPPPASSVPLLSLARCPPRAAASPRRRPDSVAGAPRPRRSSPTSSPPDHVETRRPAPLQTPVRASPSPFPASAPQPHCPSLPRYASSPDPCRIRPVAPRLLSPAPHADRLAAPPRPLAAPTPLFLSAPPRRLAPTGRKPPEPSDRTAPPASPHGAHLRPVSALRSSTPRPVPRALQVRPCSHTPLLADHVGQPCVQPLLSYAAPPLAPRGPAAPRARHRSHRRRPPRPRAHSPSPPLASGASTRSPIARFPRARSGGARCPTRCGPLAQ
nr:extensin-like [Aegilops tauschii subsp. strangulata]